MEEVRGTGRGSYIWGRSVHNIRIERLWVDFARGVGNKWIDFFYELELYYGLSHDNAAHIWLIHHLFLDAINQDVQDWAEAWNSHKLTRGNGRRRSPRDMFTFGLLEQGPRGLDTILYQEEEAAFAHIEEFGIDWAAQADPDLLEHHSQNNDVIVDPPEGPLSAALITQLDATLVGCVDINSRDMGVRKLVWQEALSICSSFF
ncbi:hypothetical protein B0H16DRAFT_1661738 [Mycena metata]|uniref:Integrase core domain-containing protein n=1 Tax=Mycena metata TaxID=1033252 RepID=A0AAD7JFK2_9AGAR|nr:hypothetical protein B0H16DRAFT_1661738 [Mycena metata]